MGRHSGKRKRKGKVEKSETKTLGKANPLVWAAWAPKITKGDLNALKRFSCNCTASQINCPMCNLRVKSTNIVAWILDSGASMHLTFSTEDFIEYEELDKPLLVRAATNDIFILGIGAVLIRHKVSI